MIDPAVSSTGKVHLAPLSGFVIPDECTHLRDFPRKGEFTDDFLSKYDRKTLFYDVHQHSNGRDAVVNAPRFFNLWPLLAGASGGRPGASLKMKRSTWHRCERVVIRNVTDALTLDINGTPTHTKIRPSQAQRFKAARAVVALNKNNHLEWITDWVRFNIRRHGADSFVLFDNGSDAYEMAELVAVLDSIEEVKAATVYHAPFPYGPLGGRKSKWEPGAKFFQSAMLNIARSDALAQAKVVLSVDIDELVDGPEDDTIFDAALRHPLGMITFKGFWAYPGGKDTDANHAAHVFRKSQLEKCNRKWCIAPGKFMGRFRWEPHQVGGILQNLFTEQDEWTHIHCRGISTGWRKGRFDFDPSDLQKDARLVDLMTGAFPDVSEAPHESRVPSP